MHSIIAYVRPKSKGWKYELRNGEMFWLPETRTVSKWEMKKLRRLRVNDEEYKRLARAERVAVAGAVIFSDFKFKDRKFRVKEGDDKHKVAYVQIVDFARKKICIHWHDHATPPNTSAPRAPPILPPQYMPRTSISFHQKLRSIDRFLYLLENLLAANCRRLRSMNTSMQGAAAQQDIPATAENNLGAVGENEEMM